MCTQRDGSNQIQVKTDVDTETHSGKCFNIYVNL